MASLGFLSTNSNNLTRRHFSPAWCGGRLDEELGVSCEQGRARRGIDASVCRKSSSSRGQYSNVGGGHTARSLPRNPARLPLCYRKPHRRKSYLEALVADVLIPLDAGHSVFVFAGSFARGGEERRKVKVDSGTPPSRPHQPNFLFLEALVTYLPPLNLVHVFDDGQLRQMQGRLSQTSSVSQRPSFD